MKTKILVILFIISTSLVHAQCDLKLLEKGKEKVNADSVTFLINFSVFLDSEKDTAAKFSITLTKNTNYRFYIFESDKYDGEGFFAIYDDEYLLGKNYIESTGNIHPYFDFKCSKSGIYHLIVKRTEGKKYCAEVILASKGKIEPKPENTINEDDEVYFIVDEMPVFIKGDDFANEFRQYLQRNLIYPQEAKVQKIEGRVFVYFVVSKDGSLKDIKIVRGVHPLLDQVALEVVENCPKWAKPGILKGKPVSVAFTFPVVFELSK